MRGVFERLHGKVQEMGKRLLDELVHSLPAGRRFMIGAGTGWIMGGDIDEYERVIDVEYERICKRLNKSVTNAKYCMQVARAELETLKEDTEAGKYDLPLNVTDIDNVNLRELDIKFKELERIYKKYVREIKEVRSCQTTINNANAMLAQPHFREREVVEVYRSIQDPALTMIVIEGKETGMYWDMDEYEEHRRATNGNV